MPPSDENPRTRWRERQGLPGKEKGRERERVRRSEKRRKKGSSGNKARGDMGDPRIHQGAQTAWSLYHGMLIYD